MKKSFTLLEVLISISLFMIMIVFLYKTLDQTKHSNKIFAKKQESIKDTNRLYNIFLEDVAESISELKISQDRDKNTILSFESNNAYHNAYHLNITYLISSNNKLVRIESKDKFNYANTPYDFYENNKTFIDVLLDDIEYFEVLHRDKKQYVFAIKQKNKKRVLFNTFKIAPIKVSGNANNNTPPATK